jgi:glycine/D-amino acid oxidase-like deaminating enzyme
VTFRRQTLSHIRDAFYLHSTATDVVINCTGLLASRLGGVMDNKVVPVRGQIVVVENESHGIFFESDDGTFDKGIGECCYIIPRPAGSFFFFSFPPSTFPPMHTRLTTSCAGYQAAARP